VARNQLKEDRKPDILLVTIERVTTLVRKNPKPFIMGLVVVLVVALAIAAFTYYRSQQNERAQFQLSQAMETLGEYMATQKEDALSRAETQFRDLTKGRPRVVSDIATLYLARITYLKGKPEEAKAMYTELASRASSPVVKQLAEQALKRPTASQPVETKTPEKQ
jgi:predicted negative regulator of RcsB-dependent stress response